MQVLNTAWFKAVASLAVFGLALGIWQLLSAANILATDSFPTMTATLAALGSELQSAELWSAVGQTLQGWAVGVGIGSAFALVVGTLLGLNRFAYRSVIPVIEFVKTVPVIAIVPLAIIVFGPTLKMKVFLVAFGVFWPLAIQVIYGVRAVDPVVRDTAKVMKLRGIRRITTVTMPSAAPYVATGFRLAAAVGLILAVIAELIGGAKGLGLSILVAQNAGPSQLPNMYALILVTGMVGVAVTSVFSMLEKRLLHWHESQRNLASRTA